MVADQRGLRRDPGPAAGALGAARRRGRRLLARLRRVLRRHGHTGGTFLPGWPVKLDGAIQTTLPLIGPGQDPAIAKIGGQADDRRLDHRLGDDRELRHRRQDRPHDQQAVYGAGLQRHRPHRHDQPLRVGLARRSSSPGAPLDVVKYGLASADVANLLLVGQNVPYNHLIGAYDATTGAPLPASRGSPTTSSSSPSSDDRQGRLRLADQPGRRRHGPRASCTPTTAPPAWTSPASPRSPAAGCSPRRRSPTTAAWPTSRARATCSSGTCRSCRSARREWPSLPPRPAPVGQLRPRRHRRPRRPPTSRCTRASSSSARRATTTAAARRPSTRSRPRRSRSRRRTSARPTPTRRRRRRCPAETRSSSTRPRTSATSPTARSTTPATSATRPRSTPARGRRRARAVGRTPRSRSSRRARASTR